MVTVITVCDAGSHYCSELSRTEVCEYARGARINVPVLGKVIDVGVADKLFETLESSLVVSWVVVVFLPRVYLIE